MSIITRMQKIDSRYIYLLLMLILIVPFLVPLKLPIPINRNTRVVYDTIQNLPADSKVLLACELESLNLAETGVLCLDFVNHLTSRPVKIYAATFVSPESAQLLETWIKPRANMHGKTYGQDYVNLGFYAGSQTSMAAFASNIPNLVKRDYYGTPIDSIPMMKGISTLKDFDLVVTVNQSELPDYMSQFYAAYRAKIVVGEQAVSYPQFTPYLSSGQVIGMLNGLVGAAEYEVLTSNLGVAVASSDALSAATILIIIFIALGNMGHFSQRDKGQKKEVK